MNEQNINPGIFGLGNPNDAYSQYFSGRSWLKMLTVERLVTANVTFEAGCRNNLHANHLNIYQHSTALNFLMIHYLGF